MKCWLCHQAQGTKIMVLYVTFNKCHQVLFLYLQIASISNFPDPSMHEIIFRCYYIIIFKIIHRLDSSCHIWLPLESRVYSTVLIHTNFNQQSVNCHKSNCVLGFILHIHISIFSKLLNNILWEYFPPPKKKVGFNFVVVIHFIYYLLTCLLCSEYQLKIYRRWTDMQWPK